MSSISTAVTVASYRHGVVVLHLPTFMEGHRRALEDALRESFDRHWEATEVLADIRRFVEEPPPFPRYLGPIADPRRARGFPSYEAEAAAPEHQLQRLRFRAPPAPPPAARPVIVRRLLP